MRFFLRFFFMWTIFKVFIEFVTTSRLFYVLVFLCQEACRILAPQPGIKPTSSSLEDKDLTTRPPGKSPKDGIFISNSLNERMKDNLWMSPLIVFVYIREERLRWGRG